MKEYLYKMKKPKINRRKSTYFGKWQMFEMAKGIPTNRILLTQAHTKLD